MSSARIPTATYRLQLNRTFRFADAIDLVAYLHALGAGDLYVSPILRARAGSPHGYDITDPDQLNPELGPPEDFNALSARLDQHGLGLLVDTVPNHMAASTDNPWWRDVLEYGRRSPHAGYFDIDWRSTDTRLYLKNKLLLPLLGGPYGRVLENGELSLAMTPGGLVVHYYDLAFPLEPRTYPDVLRHALRRCGLEAGRAAIEVLLGRFEELAASRDDPGEGRRLAEEAKWALWEAYSQDPGVRDAVDAALTLLNGTPSDPRSFDGLDRLLDRQNYRPAYWRTASERINYRRFFDITDLVAMRMQEPEVFDARHRFTLRLMGQGKITGLRIDHVDGLYDPRAYLERLQAEPNRPAGADVYAVVEKVVVGDERLPDDWPCHGTTGYDFLNAVNGLFVSAAGLAELERAHRRTTGTPAFRDLVYSQKQRVAVEGFGGELRSLTRDLGLLADDDRHARDLAREQLQEAILCVTACLPVYRTYTRGWPVADRDRRFIVDAVDQARARCPGIEAGAFDFLGEVLLLEPGSGGKPPDSWVSFVMSWQQFTGPIMAKGMEDTACYRHNPLVSLNEVGAFLERERAALSTQDFHAFNQQRRKCWPHTLNATSTHDTKRSEDVRARINVLSEEAGAWNRHLRRWSAWNSASKQMAGGRSAPDASEETLIYQTMLGAWPLIAEDVAGFRERLKVYVIKAAREGKANTSWACPDQRYEEALTTFVDRVFPDNNGQFATAFHRFWEHLAFYGALNSLAQVILKTTSPGVPDFYQGSELWDFSLVDPDNRRPVDFGLRKRLLGALAQRPASPDLVRELLETWQDGRVKLYVTLRALALRRDHVSVFRGGDYIPLSVEGRRAQHVVAFARCLDGTWILAAVPRLVARLGARGRFPLGAAWRDTRLELPSDAPACWSDVFTGRSLCCKDLAGSRDLSLQEVFEHFPVALLLGVSDGGEK